MRSLGYLLDAPVAFRAAPELFCLDLYKDFDIDRFIALAAPTKVNLRDFAQPPAGKAANPDPNAGATARANSPSASFPSFPGSPFLSTSNAVFWTKRQPSVRPPVPYSALTSDLNCDGSRNGS